jgi:hypothetical protein
MRRLMNRESLQLTFKYLKKALTPYKVRDNSGDFKKIIEEGLSASGLTVEDLKQFYKKIGPLKAKNPKACSLSAMFLLVLILKTGLASKDMGNLKASSGKYMEYLTNLSIRSWSPDGIKEFVIKVEDLYTSESSHKVIKAESREILNLILGILKKMIALISELPESSEPVQEE